MRRCDRLLGLTLIAPNGSCNCTNIQSVPRMVRMRYERILRIWFSW